MKKLSLNKGEKIIKYALRKYSFGVVTVAVSVCFFTEIASASILINENTSIQETYSTNEDLSENITQKEEQSDSDGQTAQKCACCVDTDKKP